MRQDIIDLYDAYTHERLDRRIFMDRLATMAGGTAAAAALLPVLQANYAKAAIVPPDDARVRAERITFRTPPARCRRIWCAPPMPRARSRA
jgi:carboxymethylenebutenolidase